uniref:Uncharacterized protein n=1 Tax=Anguilla anguilla TaxID=7936 RepID=A0A0E9PYY5_ANGAN
MTCQEFFVIFCHWKIACYCIMRNFSWFC